VSLEAADKSPRLTCRLSQDQQGLDERALMASQWSSKPWGRPRRWSSRHTLPAQVTSLCCVLPPRLAHRPAGWGHGGTRQSSTSRAMPSPCLSIDNSNDRAAHGVSPAVLGQASKRFGFFGALASGWLGWHARLVRGSGIVGPQPAEHQEDVHQRHETEVVEKEG
jgi:hypothetical protein